MTKSKSSRAVQSYANNWGNNIKVEIPETGVSIGELADFLREWLGHDTHITARFSAPGRHRRHGPHRRRGGATLYRHGKRPRRLMQKAAEHFLKRPSLIAMPIIWTATMTRRGWRSALPRQPQCTRLIAGDDTKERAWAWNGLGTIAANFHRDNRESATDYRKAIATVPDFTIGYFALGARDLALNRAESTIADYRTAIPLLHRDKVPTSIPAIWKMHVRLLMRSLPC